MSPLSSELEAASQQIVRLSNYLYGLPHPDDGIELTEIIRQFPDLDAPAIEQLLRKLDDNELINFDDRRERIKLVREGRLYQGQGCVPEVVFGLDYSDRKYAEAVVRIVFRKAGGDQGAGSGFFVAEPPDHIVTNRHVALNEIIQIENSENEIISEGNLPKILGSDDLDLAAIRCPTPPRVTPLRINWNHDSARPLDEVLVCGYPYIANHEPALFHAQGTITMIARRMGAVLRSSLIISDAAARGCSGGPVIGITGMVVGIVAREEEAQGEAVAPLRFISAIPSHYLQEFMPR